MDRRIIAVSFACFALTFTACNLALGAVPDPVAQPVESVSLLVKLWKSGAIAATLIVGVYVALRFASAKVAWLRRGHAALITAAALAGLAVVIEPASRGETPTLAMVWSAVVAAVAVALRPDAKPVSIVVGDSFADASPRAAQERAAEAVRAALDKQA